VKAVLAVFPFPALSVKTPELTEIEAEPEEPEVGVNVAEYETPEPLNPVSDPPETVTSPTTKFVAVSDNVNVSTSVSPTPKDIDPLREIDTVGDVTSIVTVPEDAPETLPAASIAYTLYVPSVRPVTESATLELIDEIETEFHKLSTAFVMLAASDTVTDE
jgi:hypothetical protein